MQRKEKLMRKGSWLRHIALNSSALSLVVSLGFMTEASAETISNKAAKKVAEGRKVGIGKPLNKPETIQVRAVARSVDVQKTPTSVTTIRASTLDHSNVTSISGLNGLAPGLNIAKTAGYQTNIQIRGVGMQTAQNTLTTSTGVAVYIDGVYIANSVSLDQTFFDLESIDVYRGPQATKYGQSAPGGAIVINTEDPTFDRISGKVEASGGDYNLARGRAQLNVPLTSNLAIRGSFQSYTHTGFAHTTSPYLGRYDLDDAQDNAGKLAIKWQAFSNFTATLTGQWYNSTPHGAEQKNILDTSTNPRIVNQDYPARSSLTSSLYHLNLDWKTSLVELTSVTAAQHIRDHEQYDNARVSERILGQYDILPNNNNTMNNYSETIALKSRRAMPIDWEVGLFLMGQRGHAYITEFGGTNYTGWPNYAVPEHLMTNAPSTLTYGNQQTATRFAVQPYVELGYHFTERLHLKGGARFNYDRYSSNSNGFSAYGNTSSQHSFSTKIPTWKAEIDYDLTRLSLGIESMVYFSVGTGYKPGGVNGNSTAKVIGQEFKAERILNYEIGAKNWFFNHQIMFNIAAFYANYHNMQYIADDPYPYAYGIANVPKVDLYGIEMESAYVALHDRLRIDGSLTLEKSRIVSNYHSLDASTVSTAYASSPACAYGGQYYNSACWAAVQASAPNVKGNQAPGLPNLQASLSASYLWDIPGGTLLTRAQYIYRGNYSARIIDNPLIDHVPAYFIFNAFLEYKPRASHWRMSFAATNLANTAGVNSRFTDPYGTNQTSEQYIAPRQFVGTIGYSF
ncbi:TonB-dependent receptor [Gluconobacter thailandicus NBRC 3257]|uniref:TonB-dependent receptor n=2 Tax=Gluconobacter thailandicus TaxID=257438 RepID=A0ABQ0J122_GLUTH|nr:Pesticin receptor [Gluconobacter thailandicus]GAC88971.1 TonB-dependent receptor [Gluconobacter thailandicus NBRC 3255]GAD28167.1 TonB-dependent receptor [Gluconobacter thailandicus NBRC 3257]GBR60722.1 TonB-dependent receptor [Gluconobacter thailandicus F149-1 = NBRC 100600]